MTDFQADYFKTLFSPSEPSRSDLFRNRLFPELTLFPKRLISEVKNFQKWPIVDVSNYHSDQFRSNFFPKWSISKWPISEVISFESILLPKLPVIDVAFFRKWHISEVILFRNWPFSEVSHSPSEQFFETTHSLKFLYKTLDQFRLNLKSHIW